MIERTFQELAEYLKHRLATSEPPPVVVLGAGASVESGIGAMTELFKQEKCAEQRED